MISNSLKLGIMLAGATATSIGLYEIDNRRWRKPTTFSLGLVLVGGLTILAGLSV